MASVDHREDPVDRVAPAKRADGGISSAPKRKGKIRPITPNSVMSNSIGDLAFFDHLNGEPRSFSTPNVLTRNASPPAPRPSTHVFTESSKGSPRRAPTRSSSGFNLHSPATSGKVRAGTPAPRNQRMHAQSARSSFVQSQVAVAAATDSLAASSPPASPPAPRGDYQRLSLESTGTVSMLELWSRDPATVAAFGATSGAAEDPPSNVAATIAEFDAAAGARSSPGSVAASSHYVSALTSASVSRPPSPAKVWRRCTRDMVGPQSAMSSGTGTAAATVRTEGQSRGSATPSCLRSNKSDRTSSMKRVSMFDAPFAEAQPSHRAAKPAVDFSVSEKSPSSSSVSVDKSHPCFAQRLGSKM